jgi:hypothetical protein
VTVWAPADGAGTVDDSDANGDTSMLPAKVVLHTAGTGPFSITLQNTCGQHPAQGRDLSVHF